MCKVQFDMQVTGSQANFTSDIPNFFFVLVNVTVLVNLLRSLCLGDLFSSNLTRSVATNQV